RPAGGGTDRVEGPHRRLRPGTRPYRCREPGRPTVGDGAADPASGDVRGEGEWLPYRTDRQRPEANHHHLDGSVVGQRSPGRGALPPRRRWSAAGDPAGPQWLPHASDRYGSRDPAQPTYTVLPHPQLRTVARQCPRTGLEWARIVQLADQF